MKHVFIGLMFMFLIGLAPGTAWAADEWNGSDKKLHFSVSAMVGTALGRTWPETKWKAFAWSLVPGFLKELSDMGSTGFSSKDMVWNAVGAAVGVHFGAWTIQRFGNSTGVAYRAPF